ncbi:ABC transporter permease [Oscillospiraceae bacterium Marseille-Q3528]|nr:ABC transporter permease [Oscillospiraceae bacterium Marseille-Q3528]
MAQLLEYIKMALENIRANKGRSILTMLGIIIGISSVIMIISIGNGFQDQINDQLNSMAGGQVAIYVSDDGKGDEYNITEADMEAIREKVSNVRGVVDNWNLAGTALSPKGDFDAMVTAGNWDLEKYDQKAVIRGKYFTKEDYYNSNKVCVISQNDAVRLFGTDDVIGMTLELTISNVTQEMTIVGITESEKNASGMMSMGYMSDQVTLSIPATVLEEGYGYYLGEGSYSVIIMCQSAEDSRQVLTDSLRLLEARHQCQGQSVYMTQSAADEIDQINNILGMITAFIVLVAAISLLVGGIGVMNIMLVSVTERTREIGIRKALGARTGSVLLQFLSESAIITLLGGLIGIILGLLGAYGICSLPMLGFAPGVRITTILIATVFSSSVGIFFGIYPARKAAKMHPIDALRQNG